MEFGYYILLLRAIDCFNARSTAKWTLLMVLLLFEEKEEEEMEDVLIIRLLSC